MEPVIHPLPPACWSSVIAISSGMAWKSYVALGVAAALCLVAGCGMVASVLSILGRATSLRHAVASLSGTSTGNAARIWATAWLIGATTCMLLAALLPSCQLRWWAKLAAQVSARACSHTNTWCTYHQL